MVLTYGLVMHTPVHRGRFSVTRWLAVISLLLAWPLSGGAASYTFTKIADTSGPLSRFDFPGAPSVNDAGTVAFLAGLATGGGAGGIFTGDGERITTIADSNGPFSGTGGFGQFPAINARGTVAFLSAQKTGPMGIFTGSGGPITTIVLETQLMSLGHPSINNRGTVAFKADVPGGHVDIFTSQNGSLTPILNNRGTFTGINAHLSINDAGTIAFLASLQVGRPGIFTSQGRSITTIVDTSGPVRVTGTPSINNAGVVAFFGCMEDSGCAIDQPSAESIFTGTGGPLTTIADTSGPFSHFGNPSINNAGTVVFLALLEAGGSGIFTGPDPVADQVIATGDLLFGSTVVSLGFLQGLGLNDAGQVAFFATLANGESGIFRADPVP
jgi:hypothetical protein